MWLKFEKNCKNNQQSDKNDTKSSKKGKICDFFIIFLVKLALLLFVLKWFLDKHKRYLYIFIKIYDRKYTFYNYE